MTGGFMTAGQPLRQSLLRTYDQCPQAAVWDAEGYQDYSTGPQALGTALHAVAEEIVRTLVKQDEEQMPTEEAITVMREVMARKEMPHLSSKLMDDLRMLTLRFAEYTWTPKYVRWLEERLFVDIACPDGITRTVTGQPDIMLADPPDGAIVVDLKSGQARPAAPRNPDDPQEWTKDKGRPYLSERGHFQLDVYGLLVLKTYPRVNRVTLRELHVRWGETREAVLMRDDLEHLEPRVATALMNLDLTLRGEREPEPRPGVWCRNCPRPTSCPIPWEERVGGTLTSEEEALSYARIFAVVEPLRGRLIKELKTYVDQGDGKAIDLNDSNIVGWDREGTGRRWGIHSKEA